MKCLRFNAKSTKAAQRAMGALAQLGLVCINRSSNPLCVGFWDDSTYCGTSVHESEPCSIAQSTELFTKRKEFIAAVKRVLGESK